MVSNIQPTSVRLTWIPPQYDGNSPILSYIVEAKKGSNGWQRQMDNINPSAQRVSVLVRNLLPHTQYQFRVRAENQVGIGAPSAASASIMTLIAGEYRLSHVKSSRAFIFEFLLPYMMSKRVDMVLQRVNKNVQRYYQALIILFITYPVAARVNVAKKE